MTQRRGDWMQTFTGRAFWPCDPRVDEVCIEDIAHALSMLCRFAGQTRSFYSVAEHCVRASRIVSPAYALAALLHDAAEAYVVDLPRPLKRQPGLRAYREIERRVQMIVYDAFGVKLGTTVALGAKAIRTADEVMLATEARDLMGGERADAWALTAEPLVARIIPWNHKTAERRYLRRFRDLVGKVIP